MHNFSIRKASATVMMLMAGASMASAQCYLESIEPADGSFVESLSSVNMVWKTSSGPNADFGGDFWGYMPQHIAIVDATGTQVAYLYVQQDQDWSTWPPINTYRGTVQNMSFMDTELTAPGMYRIKFPAGMFSADGDAADLSAAKEVTYYIGTGGNVDPDPVEPEVPEVDKTVCYLDSSDPANGSTVEEIGTVKMYWLDPDGAFPDFHIDVWNNMYGSATPLHILPLVDAKGNEVSKGTMGQNAWGDQHYYINFDPVVTAPGTYSFTVPEGTFVEDNGMSDNALNKATTLTFKIEGESGGGDEPGEDNSDYSLTYTSVYPAVGAIKFADGKTLDSFNLNFAEDIAVNNSKKIYVEKPDGSTVNASRMMTGSMIGAPQQLIFGFDGADEWLSGEYTVVIPKGTIGTVAWAGSGYTQGTCNDEIRLVYNYTQDPSMIDDPDDGSAFEVKAAKILDADGVLLFDLTKEGNKGAAIPGGSYFIFDTNKNDICMDAYFTLTDTTTGEVEWLAGTYRQNVTSETDVRTINGKNENGAFQMQLADILNYKIKLLEGHIYEMKMEVYLQYDGVPDSKRVKKGEAKYYIEGTTAEYVYADAKLLSITPDPDKAEITDANNAMFTVKFDKPVTMNETYTKCQNSQGAWVAYNRAETIDDGCTWEFVIPATLAAGAQGQIGCRIAPRYEGAAFMIEEGSIYKELYTSGQEGNAYQQFAVPCFLGGGVIVADPASGTVESLYKIKFTAPSAAHKNIGFQGMNGSGNRIDAILYNAQNVEVARIDRDEITDDPSGEYNISVTMHLDKEVKSAGEYRLVLPGAYFMTGTESSSYASAPVVFNYTIEGVVVENFNVGTFNIADQKHSHLSVVHTSVDGEAVAAADAKLVLKAGKEEIATAPIYAHVVDGKTMVYGHFDNIETSGESYTVVLPEGALVKGDAVNNQATVNFSGIGAATTPAEPEYTNVTMLIDNYSTLVHQAPKGLPYMVWLMQAQDWVIDEVFVNGEDKTDEAAAGMGMLMVPAETMNEANVDIEVYYKYAHEIDFDFSSGINQLPDCKYSVLSENGEIVITGLEKGDVVNVYTTAGMHIANAESTGDTVAIKAPHAVYVVTINNSSLKVAHRY